MSRVSRANRTSDYSRSPAELKTVIQGIFTWAQKTSLQHRGPLVSYNTFRDEPPYQRTRPLVSAALMREMGLPGEGVRGVLVRGPLDESALANHFFLIVDPLAPRERGTQAGQMSIVHLNTWLDSGSKDAVVDLPVDGSTIPIRVDTGKNTRSLPPGSPLPTVFRTMAFAPRPGEVAPILDMESVCVSQPKEVTLASDAFNPPEPPKVPASVLATDGWEVSVLSPPPLNMVQRAAASLVAELPFLS